jgi:hypothetical protein
MWRQPLFNASQADRIWAAYRWPTLASLHVFVVLCYLVAALKTNLERTLATPSIFFHCWALYLCTRPPSARNRWLASLAGVLGSSWRTYVGLCSKFWLATQQDGDNHSLE